MHRTTTPWLLLPLLLAGCGILLGPSNDRSRIFVLTPIESAAAPASGNTLSVSVKPVRLPEYLDGKEIVTRVAGNELRQDSLERWAEPLEDGFTRALGQNLATLLETDRVATTVWYGKELPTYSVGVEVERFEPSTDGTATLVARWAVRSGSGDRVITVRESRHVHNIAGASTTAAVDALSACLADLSRDIAAAILQAEGKSAD